MEDKIKMIEDVKIKLRDALDILTDLEGCLLRSNSSHCECDNPEILNAPLTDTICRRCNKEIK